MLGKLQYDLGNDSDVQDSTEVASLCGKNKGSFNRNAALRHNPQYTIMDLVAIFTDEAVQGLYEQRHCQLNCFRIAK